jgi:CheY-like chemotaxis protein
LVHGELVPRLALQTILQAGGYTVDVAGTPEEALGKLDKSRYELVLTDSSLGSRRAAHVLAYARIKEYRPATALINSYEPKKRTRRGTAQMSVPTENLASLLEGVAELIGLRAIRKHRLAGQTI